MSSVDLLGPAVANNLAWCASSCPGDLSEEGLWVTRRVPLPYFPDAVTTRPGVSAARMAAVTSGRPACSVKDSFADVDLAAAGFDEIFSARWIGCEGSSMAAAPADWRPVTTRADLDRWCVAAGLSHLPASELTGHSVVLARESGGESAVGCVVTEAAGVVGLSNVAAPDADTWRELLGVVAARWPGTPVVGYEHGADLDAARDAGFADLGPLRVWARS